MLDKYEVEQRVRKPCGVTIAVEDKRGGMQKNRLKNMSRELLAKIAITFDGFVVQKVDVYADMWDGRCGARDEAEGHEKNHQENRKAMQDEPD